MRQKFLILSYIFENAPIGVVIVFVLAFIYNVCNYLNPLCFANPCMGGKISHPCRMDNGSNLNITKKKLKETTQSFSETHFLQR